jgi:hypothetical protein
MSSSTSFNAQTLYSISFAIYRAEEAAAEIWPPFYWTFFNQETKACQLALGKKQDKNDLYSLFICFFHSYWGQTFIWGG